MLSFQGLLCCRGPPQQPLPRSLVFHRRTTAVLFRAHRDMQGIQGEQAEPQDPTKLLATFSNKVKIPAAALRPSGALLLTSFSGPPSFHVNVTGTNAYSHL